MALTCLLSPPTPNNLISIAVGKETCGVPVSHVLLIRKPDPWEQRVIQPYQDVYLCVCGGWGMNSSFA
jgi:hypothetical protein